MKGIIQRSVAELANIEVEIIHIAPPEYWSTVATMFAGGAEPDVTFMSEPLRQYAVNGSLLALEDLIKGDPDVNIDDFYKVALGHFTYNDKLYGLPKDVNTWVVFYNEDMFEAAGLKTPWVYFQEGNWTWEVYVDLAQKLTKRDGNRVVQFGSSYPGIGGWQYSAWVFANGGQILDDSRTRCLLTDPRTVETWQFTVDLANKYKVAPSPADQDGT
jgi:multiple sugar transport system substrate-binding protein